MQGCGDTTPIGCLYPYLGLWSLDFPMFLTSSSSNPLVSGVLENRLDFDVFVLSSQGNTGGLGAIGGYNGRRLVSKTGG